ncbi:MAG: hypothetical protein ABSG17_09530 [Spirochaetia bacterium]|jgi:hypothetical protein
MKVSIRPALLPLLVAALFACDGASLKAIIKNTVSPTPSGAAKWAMTVNPATNASSFVAVAVDSSGNIYAAGTIYGGTFGFGNGVTATGVSSANAVLVKYNSSGLTQWAQTVSPAPSISSFSAVAVDSSSGNIYAAGSMNGGTFGFGNGVSAAGAFSSGANVVLVKYNSSGLAQWAQSVSPAPSSSNFNSVAVDSSGNIYAAGVIGINGSYGFGNSVTAAGTYSGANVVLVKYNSSGSAQWAQTVNPAPDASSFNAVAVDSSSNIYAAGYINTNGSFGFGNSITAAGAYSASGGNLVLVKYNSSGLAQWAQSVSPAPSSSNFNSVAVDSSGNIYAAGSIVTNGSYGFGNSVTAVGFDGTNVVLVKYNSSGLAQWAQTDSASNSSNFNSVAVDSVGNIYAAGTIYGGTNGFGNGVTATGIFTIYNMVLVKYNSSGMAQWAQTDNPAPGKSWFYAVAVDSSGNVYAAGNINTYGTYGFGNGVTAVGAYASANNLVLVKYAP